LIVRLIRPDGTTATPETKAESATIIVTPGELRNGTHVLSWRVVSADGHPLGGSLIFSVGSPRDVSTSPKLETDAQVRAAIWIARFVLYVGLFIGVGGAIFVALLVERRPLPGQVETWLSGMMMSALVVAPVTVGLQGLDALALPL